MEKLNWDEIQKLASNAVELHTKEGIPFQIAVVSENRITVCVSSKQEYTIRRKTLEAAVTKIQNGAVLDGPKDYREQVADERPAYAWAILKHLGWLK